MPRPVKLLLKWGAHRAGLLTLFHRIRNRRTLTVVLFHRVLSPADPRWPSALPEWTVSDDFFERCLRFFRDHYSVVTLEAVVGAARAEARLPPRSLLITFDDGYADNAEYALPLLRRYRLPAAVFVYADAVDNPRRPWTEDLMAAYRAGRVSDDDVRRIAAAVDGGGAGRAADTDVRAVLGTLAARWAGLPEPRVQAALAQAGVVLDRPADPPQMVTAAQLRELRAGGVAIGAHGRTHAALTHAPDLDDELRAPPHTLAGVLGVAPDAIDTLAFPYGAHDARVLGRARDAGYGVVFTLVPQLNPTVDGRLVSSALSRVNVSEPELAPGGVVDPVAFAMHFFRMPHAPSAPTAGRS